MLGKYLIFISLAVLTGLIRYADMRYPEHDLAKLFYTSLTLTLAYLVLKLLLEGLLSRNIRDARTRYSFRKTTQILFALVSFIVILRIWIPNPQALLVAYGLVAAGVAIALQDVFKNFAGALAILLTSIYRVGDRIEINGKYGDVIDIGIFYTSLLELREWVHGDQTTGRITLIPNGLILNTPVHNYTKDHNFIWDELSLPITYNSDWARAVEMIRTIVETRTGEATKRAERGISHLEEKYYLSKRNIEPTIFVTPTDNWIMLHIRYVVDVRERRLAHNEIMKLILESIQTAPDITIASQTMTISTDQTPPTRRPLHT